MQWAGLVDIRRCQRVQHIDVPRDVIAYSLREVRAIDLFAGAFVILPMRHLALLAAVGNATTVTAQGEICLKYLKRKRHKGELPYIYLMTMCTFIAADTSPNAQ